MRVWELLARSEIVVRGDSGAPWLPLERQGQGIKSLSVIYLFNAFVERLLAEAYSEHSEPIVALEEPEVHLHPQAARALWPQIDAMPGQKIVASHSPYFVQFVPIKDLRLLRSSPSGARLFYLPDKVEVELPPTPAVASLAARHTGLLSCDQTTGQLSATGPIAEELYRDLLRCFPGSEDQEHHLAIRALREKARLLLDACDLEVLDDWARRIRGEIFFSRFWVLCEGQSEVFLLSALFDAVGYPLDRNSVSLIDYQNNGSPRAFACLARAFGFQWALLADGDSEGRGTIRTLERAHFPEQELQEKVVCLPNGVDLEAYIATSTLRTLALEVMTTGSPGLADDASDEVLADALRSHKPLWARRLGELVRRDPSRMTDLPGAFSRLREIVLANEPHASTTGT